MEHFFIKLPFLYKKNPRNYEKNLIVKSTTKKQEQPKNESINRFLKKNKRKFRGKKRLNMQEIR